MAKLERDKALFTIDVMIESSKKHDMKPKNLRQYKR